MSKLEMNPATPTRPTPVRNQSRNWFSASSDDMLWRSSSHGDSALDRDHTRSVSPQSTVPSHSHQVHGVQNNSRSHWDDLLRFHQSVIPRIFLYLTAITLWASLVAVFALTQSGFAFLNKLPVSTIFVVTTGVVLSLLLSFRLSTAYDRYWEGRKFWSTIRFQTINIARHIQINIRAKSDSEKTQKGHALSLLTGFSVAVKHWLRKEFLPIYDDLAPHIDSMTFLLANPAPISSPKDSKLASPSPQALPITCIIPLDALNHLFSYILSTNQSTSQMVAAFSSLEDAFTQLERIGGTPIPATYAVTLDQVLVLYLLALPFQLVTVLGWSSIPATMLAALIMVGLAEISQNIENPFVETFHNLPLDSYCEHVDVCMEYLGSMDFDGETDLRWGEADEILDEDEQVRYGGGLAKSVTQVRVEKKAETVALNGTGIVVADGGAIVADPAPAIIVGDHDVVHKKSSREVRMNA
ncbi:hypothetical protein HDU77_004906 [Chytriomyces hyalinus]|nr:hypothetical protein HDU77_004906 [Chytriomyces hyalinus]